MRKFLTNNKILVGIAILAALYGITHSLIACDFNWFLRSGSFIVAIGIILLSRTFLLGEDLLLYMEDVTTTDNTNSPEYYEKLGLKIPDNVKADVSSRKAIGWYGPVISTIGTIIWGYGDLLNHFIHVHAC